MRFLIRLALGLVLLVLASPPALAQSYAIDQGSLMVGGSASFTSTGSDDSDDDRFSSLLVRPMVQYFVMPGLAVGGELMLTRFSSGDQSATAYGVGPEVTYFFGGSERQLYPFVSAGFQFNRSEDENTFGYGASGGAVFMLTSSVGLNGSLYYRKIDYEDFGGNNTIGAAVGISAFVF
jgi:opacity protein-like surface antigen